MALARLVLGPRDERAGAAEPRARRARAAAARGRQRLGRRLAGDGRLHQSRGAVADARASCARRTEAAGQRLRERLPVYPEYLLGRPEFFDPRVRDALLRAAPTPTAMRAAPDGQSQRGGRMTLDRLLAARQPRRARASSTRALDGRELGVADAERLLDGAGRRPPRADAARPTSRARDGQGRRRLATSSAATSTSPTSATWAARSAASRATRTTPDAYDHPMDELLAKARDAVARGATEVCIQGGIHPNKDHTHYREILRRAQGASSRSSTSTPSRPRRSTSATRRAACRSREYLRWLMDAGLGTMPGTAAEILDDEVRKVISPQQAQDATRWIEIVDDRARRSGCARPRR